MTRRSERAPGVNRTGGAFHPYETASLIDLAARAMPTGGDSRRIASVRNEYSAEAATIGHLPTIASGAKRAKKLSPRAAMLLDKLGERLAFERAGARLYEALLAKRDAPPPIGPGLGGPDRLEIARMCAEELAHFRMLTEEITRLGGDPTAVTPAAEVGAVATSGLAKVLLDPRTTFHQCLDAMLIAELTDQEAWSTLCDLAEAEGLRDLVVELREALETEMQHLALVREWVATATLSGACAADDT